MCVRTSLFNTCSRFGGHDPFLRTSLPPPSTPTTDTHARQLSILRHVKLASLHHSNGTRGNVGVPTTEGGPAKHKRQGAKVRELY